jgi:LacI family repressor for deo operon, udp, cdd, tsx, nupC, and nupG
MLLESSCGLSVRASFWSSCPTSRIRSIHVSCRVSREAAQLEGYAVLLGDTQHDPKREERYTLMLQRREAEGLIVLGHGLPEAAVAVSKAMSNEAPIVSGCEFNPRVGIPSVHIDNQSAARDAMEHLYSLGHRRIGIITGPMLSGLSRESPPGSVGAGTYGGR